MEPQTPQFNLPTPPKLPTKISSGVSVGPKGSFGPTTKGDALTRTTEPWTKKNAEIMAQRKNSVDGKTAKPGPGTFGRPTPNQGITVPGTGGKPPVTIGGEKGIKVHVPKVRGGLGLGGGGGIFGKMIR